MALVLRVGVAKLVCNNFSNRLCKVPRIHNVVQAACLSGKGRYIERPKPPPYPYWKKTYKLWDQFTDFTLGRIDENSKLIVVEGPPAVGKSKLCEELAEEFNLLYMPAPTFADLYTFLDGHDMRLINNELPLKYKLIDLDLFYKYPKHPASFTVQYSYFLMRLEQYCNALLHILSTGQGVILNRSVYSDSVFMEATYRAGYVSKQEYKFYNQHLPSIEDYLLRPHAIIYLDVPVNIVMDKIKKRGIQSEVESSVINEQYLKTIEDTYKTKVLKSLMSHSHILCFDWSKGGNIDAVKLDLEELPLDEYKSGLLSDWVLNSLDEVRNRRKLYQDKDEIFLNLPMGLAETPDSLWEDPHMAAARDGVMAKLFGEKYADGYQPRPEGVVEKYLTAHQNFYIRRRPRDFINRKFNLAK